MFCEQPHTHSRTFFIKVNFVNFWNKCYQIYREQHLSNFPKIFEKKVILFNFVNFWSFQKDHLEKLFRSAVARQTDVMVQNILGNGIGLKLQIKSQVVCLKTNNNFRYSSAGTARSQSGSRRGLPRTLYWRKL